MPPLVSVIIINYNTGSLTRQAIRSVLEETRDAQLEIIVWDNASADNSLQMLHDAYGTSIQLHPSPSNCGFSLANNEAAKYARGDYLLLLNPDTIVLDRAIDKLVRFAELFPQAGIWGGKTLFPDGTINPSSCWRRQTLWSLTCQACGLSSLFRTSRIFNPETISMTGHKTNLAVDIVSGCFLLISKELWTRLEGFDTSFFMYGEDADLCLRAKSLGYSPMVTKGATIIHYGAASETVWPDKVVRLLKAKMMLMDKHFRPSQKILAIPLLSSWPYSRFISHKICALVKSRVSSSSAKVWHEVWKRSSEWRPNARIDTKEKDQVST